MTARIMSNQTFSGPPLLKKAETIVAQPQSGINLNAPAKVELGKSGRKYTVCGPQMTADQRLGCFLMACLGCGCGIVAGGIAAAASLGAEPAATCFAGGCALGTVAGRLSHKYVFMKPHE